ncbi:OpgC domain-containing protein [Myxococcaceae bacterium GXIMD 01537]
MSTAVAKSPARNETLDVLRGGFIVVMMGSHLGAHSAANGLFHVERWATAASGFVCLSGLVLGLVSRRRLARAGVRGTHVPLWRRALELWAVHLGLMGGLFVLRQLTGLFEAPSVEAAGGWGSALWQVATLRLQSADLMNILPLYVVLLGAAPLAVEACRRGLTWLVLGPSLALYALAQFHPEVLRMTNAASGPQVFSLAAWQFVFFLGFALGWWREELTARVWTPHQRWLVPVGLAVYGALFLLAQLHRPRFGAWHLLSPAQEAFWFGREAHGPGLLLFFLTRLMVLSLLVEAWRRSGLGAPVRRALVLLGQNSLLCFVAHIPLALAVKAFGGAWPGFAHNLAIAGAVGAVYLLVRVVEGAPPAPAPVGAPPSP